MSDVLDSSCPDSLLQSQWSAQFAPDFFDVPERRLFLAVLVDALRILRTGTLKDRHTVVTWIRGQDARLTFHAICDGLNLDAPHITAQMLEVDRETPVPRRAVSARKGQTPGRRGSRHGDGLLVPALMPTPVTDDTDPFPARPVEDDTGLEEEDASGRMAMGR